MSRNKYDIDEVLERKLDFSKLKRMGAYLKPHLKLMALALLLIALASILGLLIPKFLQIAIDEVIPLGRDGIPRLIRLSVYALAAILVSSLFTTFRNVITVYVGQAMIYDIRRDLFNKLQVLPFTYYDSRPHGKILVRVVNYVNAVSDTMTNGILNAIVDLLNIIFIAAFMFTMDVTLSLYVLAGLPILLTITVILKKYQKIFNFDRNNKSSNLTAYTCESIYGVKVTQIFERQEENRRIFARLNRLYHKAWMRMAMLNNCMSPITEFLKEIAVGLVYIAGVLIITDATGAPKVDVGVLIAMGTYASRFWQPFLSLANIYNNLFTTISYLERIFETMDEPVDIVDAPDAVHPETLRGEVEFRHLTFSYEKGIVVLPDFSLKVPAGHTVALVGETGSGKSTAVSLISRFYPVEDGQLFIDGYDINKIGIRELRSNMGVMLQDSFIFSGTIADNIRYGRLDATDEEVRAAAKAVCADDFIKNFPDGYDTVVNERGGMLSQGEKQLISFARTLLSDPAILILDEATSSIDAKTEKLLQKGIEALLKGRTSFLIAHRLSTIRHSDCIYYMEGGQIIESGTHEELMQIPGGKYRHLCTVQTLDEAGE